MKLIWSDYHSKLHQTLKSKQILPKNSKIIIAVSGGQDSLCLARLILDLQPKWSWQYTLAHCDHRWALDQGLPEHLQKIADDWGVNLQIISALHPIKENESSARQWRYQVLTELAQELAYDYVITGHTLTDRAETLIYNLLRGAGSDGLRALDWSRPLSDSIGLVRPLLNFSRQDTDNFCQQFQLPIWWDTYNENKQFRRNRIRLELMPYLQHHFNPQVENHLAHTAEILKAEGEYLHHQAQLLLTQGTINSYTIDRKILQEKPLALQRRAIKQFLVQNLPKMPSFEQIEAVVKLIDAPNKSQTSTMGRRALVRVENDYLIIEKP